jgi:predicted acetyltransferase
MVHETPQALDFGPLRDAADRDACAALVGRSFALPQSDLPAWVAQIGEEHLRLARRGRDPAGCLGLLEMGQHFGGRSVPTGGVVAVGIEPELRGRGIGRELMSAALQELGRRGIALSTLYPATQSFYRGVGYELAGGRYELRVAAGAIGIGDHELALRRLSEADAPALQAIHARAAARSNGWLARHPYLWKRVRESRGETREGYGVERAGELQAYLFLARRRDATGRHDVALSDFVALDAASGRRLWAFLADHRSLANDVIWHGGPADPWLALLPEASYRMSLAMPWMIRVVDVRAALEARGYPAAIRAELELEVEDELLVANAGRWTLRVEHGRGRVERGGRGRLALGVRGLAALYSGFHGAEALAAFGALAAPPEDQALASALFSGASPTMPDMF